MNKVTVVGNKSIVDISKGKDYYTQRNNKEYALEACNPTSHAMACEYIGAPIPAPKGIESDDYFASILRNEQSMKEFKEKYADYYKQGYYPNEIHDFVVKKYNQLIAPINGTHSVFRTSWTTVELLVALLNGKGVIMSGNFPYYSVKQNKSILLPHVVVLVGFKYDGIISNKDIYNETDIDVRKVGSYIIDDPFGDYRTQYKNKNGNGIEMNPNDYKKILKVSGKPDIRWGYVIGRL